MTMETIIRLELYILKKKMVIFQLDIWVFGGKFSSHWSRWKPRKDTSNDTLPETNFEFTAETSNGWKMTFLFGVSAYFQVRSVSFWEGIHLPKNMLHVSARITIFGPNIPPGAIARMSSLEG